QALPWRPGSLQTLLDDLQRRGGRDDLGSTHERDRIHGLRLDDLDARKVPRGEPEIAVERVDDDQACSEPQALELDAKLLALGSGQAELPGNDESLLAHQ